MWLEFTIFILTAFFAANHLFDGYYVRQLLTYRKHYQVLGIFAAGFICYWMLRFRPQKLRGLIVDNKENLLAHLPIDSDSAKLLNPIIDFTKSYSSVIASGESNGRTLVRPVVGASAVGRTKRNVSESVKKTVAASQAWKCGHCKEMLSATYEIDHKIRLEFGGSNAQSNLEALCRNCHGNKTIKETAAKSFI